MTRALLCRLGIHQATAAPATHPTSSGVYTAHPIICRNCHRTIRWTIH